jgi:hypothetical protein
MVNSAPIVQWTAVLAIAGATILPFTVRAETLLNQEADAQQVPEYASRDSGGEQTVAAPTPGVAEATADFPAPALRSNDPARRCGNIMSVWDEPCNYAGQTRVSVDTTGIRP